MRLHLKEIALINLHYLHSDNSAAAKDVQNGHSHSRLFCPLCKAKGMFKSWQKAKCAK